MGQSEHLLGRAARRWRFRCRPEATLLLAVAGLALAGCQAVPPPYAASHRYGTVRAASLEDATRVAGWVEELVPKVRGLLPETRSENFDVWVQEDLHYFRGQRLPEHITGFVYATGSWRRIHLRSDAPFPKNALCHELVHALLTDRWRTLPAVIEEGLCDFVARTLVADGGERARARRLIDAARYLGEVRLAIAIQTEGEDGTLRRRRLRLLFVDPPEGEELEPLEVLKLASRELGTWRRLSAYHYGFGYWLAERLLCRIGFDGLLALCASAERSESKDKIVPVRAVMKEAELPSQEFWRTETLEQIGTAELRQIVAENRERIVRAVSRELLRHRESNESFDALVARTGVSLQLGTVETHLELMEEAGFQAELLHALRSR